MYKQVSNYNHIYGNYIEEPNGNARDKKACHKRFKNSFADLIIRVDTVEKRIKELPDRPIKILQKKIQRKESGKKRTQHPKDVERY